MSSLKTKRVTTQNGAIEVEVPFTVVIDTREQIPYRFLNLYDNKDWKGRSPLLIVPTVRETLKTGDYTVKGYEDSLTIERKSKEDLWGSIFHERENFIAKLERMRSMEWSAVMIEASWNDMLVNPEFSGGNPKSLSRTVQAWILRYPTHWIMAPNREFAEALTFRLLQRFWLDKQEGSRENEQYHPSG